MPTLIFEPVEVSKRQLVLRYAFDDLRFSTTYWYDSVDLLELSDQYGEAFMRSVWFHLLAFEANKVASLKPDRIDFGPYTDLVTDEFWHLWETIFHNVWGVWRYENSLPDFRLQRPENTGGGAVAAAEVTPGPVEMLMLCGGGKDSLSSMRLLEVGEVPYDVFVYSHSTYGRGTHQHELIDGLLAHTNHGAHHRGWVLDDAIDSPAADVLPEYGITRMIAAETVSSYWTALPVALAHGYTSVALGITKSTDEHNLTWEQNGEHINYLWGMSTVAEEMLHDYIRDQLISNVSMFHILRPIYDVNVFTMLNGALNAVPATHSCAQNKPWCGRCAKCIYVWMNYVAWLPEDVVAETVEINMFERSENRLMLRKMLGLESYKPTDCVGTVSEARLAFLMARRKGVGGVIVDDIDLAPFEAEAEATLSKYGAVADVSSVYPDALAEVVVPQLVQSSEEASRIAREVLDNR